MVGRNNAGGVVEAWAQNVTQSGRNVGIGAGFNYNRTAEGKWLTETDKAKNLTQPGLLTRQGDWTTGNTTQYPMLVDLDGGHQDIQRLSPEFKQAIRDYAPPSNNSDASWFGPAIWKALGWPPIGKPLYQVVAPDGYFYVVVYQEASQSLLLVGYDAQGEWNPHCGMPSCWHRQSLMQGLENATIDSGVLHGNTLYLAVNDPGSQSRLLVLPLESGLMREVSIPANVYGLKVWENRLYLTGTDGSRFFLSSKALPLTETSVNAGISDLDSVGHSLLVNNNAIYVAGQSGGSTGNLIIRRFSVDGLQPVQSLAPGAWCLIP